MSKIIRGLLVSVAALGGLAGGPVEAKVTRYLTGSAADVSPPLYGPALNLGGGGPDVDAAIQWMIDQARGCTSCSAKVDVVVIRATGGNAYNAPIAAMQGVDSVETLVVPSRRDANTAEVDTVVRRAEVVFFAGGDQCTYVNAYAGTAVTRAVDAVWARGGVVGGTSAGAMVQGEHIYDACNGSVYSDEALADPYNRYMSFRKDFFVWNVMDEVIVDTHFAQRDRMGRLMGFVARRIRDGYDPQVMGLGINEGTSVVVDRTGLATVMGAGPAYFVLGTHAPERCEPLQPLRYTNFRIWRVAAGGTFDLWTWPTSGYFLRTADNGVISSHPY
jgi:cyanophycinase